MTKVRWLSQAQYLLLYTLAFSIPFPFLYSSIFIILLSITWFFNGRLKETFQNFVNRKALWFWVLFFILHAISYMYSDNKYESAFDLESKMSFVVLPIVIGAGIDIKRSTLEKFFAAFIYGITVVAILCLLQAIFLWTQTNNTDVFFYHELVRGLDANAVYMAWYVFMAITALLFFEWDETILAQRHFLRNTILILLALFFLLLSSKMLIVFFFLFLLPVYIWRQWRGGGLSVLRTTMVIFLLAGVASAIALTNNPISVRFKDLTGKSVEYAYRKDYRGTDEKFNNLTLRLFLWRLGLENVEEQHAWLAGVGNGDVHELQNAKMDEYGIRNINNPKARSNFYNVNIHNMFIQTLLMLGMIGLITFVIIVFSPFLVLRKVKNPSPFLFFFVISVLFMIQESALQTQAGIIYFTLFTTVYWNYYHLNSKKSL